MPISLLSLLLSAFVAGLIIGSGAIYLYLTIKHQEERIRQLEQASAKHLPYKSADAIEDATAVLIAAKSELDLKVAYVDNILAHLQKARNPETTKN
jgi:hypothetical protein